MKPSTPKVEEAEEEVKLEDLIATSHQTKVTYTLSFEFTFEYDLDDVWFASSIPYTYTMLTQFINSTEEEQINMRADAAMEARAKQHRAAAMNKVAIVSPKSVNDLKTLISEEIPSASMVLKESRYNKEDMISSDREIISGTNSQTISDDLKLNSASEDEDESQGNKNKGKELFQTFKPFKTVSELRPSEK